MIRKEPLRILLIALLVGTITVLHYVTNLHDVRIHDIYRRLYYLPIILAGLWFSLRGGLITSLTVSVLFIPHVVFQWQHHPTVEPEQYLEIILYNVIGFLTGWLAGRERTQQEQAEAAARDLAASYSELQRQAERIVEFEDQLRRADRLAALGELSAGMAHEIRNPLASIRGTAEILRDGIPADDPRGEFAAILIREVDRLNGVVSRFLDFARPAPLSRDRVDLRQLLAEVVTLTRLSAQKRRVNVDLTIAGDGILVADADGLKQAFLNLILNAFDAMPGGGMLRIAVTAQKDCVVIAFADSGAGIAGADLDKIFSPFFTTRRDGTGLGLAITQRIIGAHGGRIAVTSIEGQGTTFTIELPAPPAVKEETV